MTTELQLKEQELQLRREELELERTRLSIEFAKFGFSGTLTAAVLGMAVVIALALLSAFTPFEIDGWILVLIAFVILIGSIVFGAFSLWQVPTIAASFRGLQLKLEGGKKEAADHPSQKGGKT